MDPVTHALFSATIGRAGATKLTRYAIPMLLVSGTAADLDWASAAGGPGKFLEWHRGAAHSLVGAAIIAAIVTAVFASSASAPKKQNGPPFRIAAAFLVCLLAALAHVGMDLLNSTGVELFWPFSAKRHAMDIFAVTDAWLLLVLLLFLGVPSIFRMATQEIGARAKSGVSVTAIAALILIGLYTWARWGFHARAVASMHDELFHAEIPLRESAYPLAANPFQWYGVVDTHNTVQEAVVPILFGKPFDSDRATIFHKPPDSGALEIAETTDTAREFLRHAQFPRAMVVPIEGGVRVEIYDLRFDKERIGAGGISAVIELDTRMQVTDEKFQWGSPLER
jgi:membrane-bound metal-dependent hydrolase YbcI (DUF457 family)